ncbi:glutathione S-transferase family protein [Thalassotalea sp. HSM 43]|uniref:glutathione S-transferase family protein n=1 Tax=Thalassotalea sp. HSM 43 TaxID=2552945 RepID=UPI0010808479|nr:glutathione S-transferase family protein [Thalassotalea sp. HSM 43]QBY04548.1 glutathione S-transferase family protein [Thalassotalea sp. HSM 43]
MRLLSSDFSPYSTRVRIQIRKKSLPIDICAPEPALRTPEFLNKYPLGKIPVLELDDGRHLAESWTIMQYLEQVYPEVSLSSDDAFSVAQMSQIGRYADLHLGPSLFPMFRAVLLSLELNIDDEVAAIKAELNKGDRLLAGQDLNRSVNIADIALATTMFFTLETPKLFNIKNLLADYDNLNAWWQWVQKDADVALGIDEMNRAFKGFVAASKQAS